MRFVLLRHGKTAANEKRLYCGFSDVELCDQGRNDLLALKDAGFYPDLNGLALITSGMRRTDETLRLLFGAKPDFRIPGFREMNFGKFELCSYEQLKADPSYQDWITDASGETPTPGGESAKLFRKRIFEAVDGLKQDALIVCHGGVIAALMDRWFKDEGKNMYQWQPSYGCGYEVIWENGLPSYRILSPHQTE